MKKIAVLILMIVSGVSFAQNKETRTVGTFTKIAFRVPGKLILKQGSPQSVVLEGNKETLAKIETEVSGNRLSIGTEKRWMDWSWRNENKITAYVTVSNIEGVSVSGSGDLIGDGKISASDLDLNVSGSGSLDLEVAATGTLDADVSGSGDIKLKGSCQNFESTVSGSGKVSVTAIISGKANVDVSGSGKISASGTAQQIKATISGSGEILAADLEVSKCEVRISGSGDAEVNVKNELDANIAGSGSVRYKGSPSQVNSHAAGSGKIKKM